MFHSNFCRIYSQQIVAKYSLDRSLLCRMKRTKKKNILSQTSSAAAKIFFHCGPKSCTKSSLTFFSPIHCLVLMIGLLILDSCTYRSHMTLTTIVHVNSGDTYQLMNEKKRKQKKDIMPPCRTLFRFFCSPYLTVMRLERDKQGEEGELWQKN